MSAYTVSRLALDAGVSVHIVRDYLLRGLLRPVACTPGGYGLFDDAALQRLCFVRAAFEAGIGLDALARLCRALDAADGDEAAASVGAKRWPIWRCSWPPCRPSRHSTRRVCHEQPRALAVRDAQTDHRLPVGRAGRAHLSLPFADSRHCAGRHDGRRVHRRVLGYRSPHADRFVRPVCDTTAAGLQRSIMSASH